MLNRLFGDYLTKKGILSKSEVNGILPVAPEAKASVEVIAIIQKVLTVSQVTGLLSQIDKKKTRFGDAAVQKGMLTEDRLDQILTYQNNSFMVFVQVLIDRRVIRYEQIPQLIDDFQRDGQYKDNQFAALLNDDLEQIVSIFVPLKNPYLKVLTVLLVKTFRRLIDKDMYLERAYTAKSIQLDSYAAQLVTGDIHYKLYLSGFTNNLLGISNYFTGATYTAVNADALDNVSEFINCVNGQFATNVSYDDVEVDMSSPEYGLEGPYISNSKLFIIPIHVNGFEIRAVYEVLD